MQISARGKLVAERLKKQAEEAERIRLEEEAEKQRIRELEEEEERERQRKAEEKERKKEKRKEKIAQQKRDGTYMTPAQRRKAEAAAASLEAMKAAGMTVGPGAERKKRPVYDNKRRKGSVII